MSEFEIEDIRSVRNSNITLDAQPLDDEPEQPKNPLDEEKSLQQLKTIEGWWLEQIDAHAQNRSEQLVDHDFYDHEQWDQKSIATLQQRGQAPLVFNLIHPVIDWIVGTERRTRVDWNCFPRKPGAEKIAEAKTKVLKFTSDTNGVPYIRSKAFKDAAISGVGWTRQFGRLDQRVGIPVGDCYTDWKSVRWDPYSRQDDMSDCRSISIERYMDLDYAIALWPEREQELRSAASKMIDPSLEFLTDDALMPQVFFAQHSSLMPMAAISGTMSVGRRQRARVRIIETEYRRPIVAKYVQDLVGDYPELDGTLYDPSNNDVEELVKNKKLALDDRLADHIWIAFWHPGFFLEHKQSPYRHDKFSLTPIWCFRRHRDGMPYGYVRGLRDPQEEYNKRRSKALFAMSTNRVTFDDDAVDLEDEDSVRDEVNRPDGFIRLAAGSLAAGKFKIENNIEIGEGHLKLMQQARQDIHEGSGVTQENLGLGQNDQSGKAIVAKQQQGAVSSAELFDNYRMHIQLTGQKQLSLAEQYITAPMQIRITGDDETQWLAVNQPSIDPNTGDVVWENDLTKDECDFVVDEQDYRETVRAAMAEMLMDTISKMPPQLAIQLLDLAIDLTDIPNRDEFVKRIRAINGADKLENPDPAQQQAEAEQQNAERQAALDKTRSEANRNNAAAKELDAKASHTSVKTKGDAMNVAEHVKLTPSIAPAADRLAQQPIPAGQFTNPGTLEVQGQPNPNGIPFPQMIKQR